MYRKCEFGVVDLSLKTVIFQGKMHMETKLRILFKYTKPTNQPNKSPLRLVWRRLFFSMKNLEKKEVSEELSHFENLLYKSKVINYIKAGEVKRFMSVRTC